MSVQWISSNFRPFGTIFDRSKYDPLSTCNIWAIIEDKVWWHGFEFSKHRRSAWLPQIVDQVLFGEVGIRLRWTSLDGFPKCWISSTDLPTNREKMMDFSYRNCRTLRLHHFRCGDLWNGERLKPSWPSKKTITASDVLRGKVGWSSTSDWSRMNHRYIPGFLNLRISHRRYDPP